MARSKSSEKQTPKRKKRAQVSALLRDELTQQCLLLRKKGLSQRAIAETLIAARREGDDAAGVTPDPNFTITYRTVGNYLGAALAELAAQNKTEAANLRELELTRLDYLLECLAPVIEVGDSTAINAALRISESRRKLLGLDAVEKVENDVTMRVIYGSDGSEGTK